VEKGIQTAGVGKFQYRLFVIFGLVWLADAMQVLSIGFSAPSIAKTFGKTVPEALQTGTFFFIGMLIGAFVFGRLADRIGRRPVLMMAVVIDALRAWLRPLRPSSPGCWCCASSPASAWAARCPWTTP
jgi:putative MFS transporter